MRNFRKRPEYDDNDDHNGSCGSRRAGGRGRTRGTGSSANLPGLNTVNGRPAFG
jgi:hypothetical protein